MGAVEVGQQSSEEGPAAASEEALAVVVFVGDALVSAVHVVEVDVVPLDILVRASGLAVPIVLAASEDGVVASDEIVLVVVGVVAVASSVVDVVEVRDAVKTLADVLQLSDVAPIDGVLDGLLLLWGVVDVELLQLGVAVPGASYVVDDAVVTVAEGVVGVPGDAVAASSVVVDRVEDIPESAFVLDGILVVASASVVEDVGPAFVEDVVFAFVVVGSVAVASASDEDFALVGEWAAFGEGADPAASYCRMTLAGDSCAAGTGQSPYCVGNYLPGCGLHTTFHT